VALPPEFQVWVFVHPAGREVPENSSPTVGLSVTSPSTPLAT
jgi:hypothetical protein